MKKIRALLYTSAPASTLLAAIEWHKGFAARDRLWLCELAKIAPDRAAMKWSQIEAADQARLLAAFERLRLWVQVHDQFSVGADIEEYADSIGFFNRKEKRHG